MDANPIVTAEDLQEAEAVLDAGGSEHVAEALETEAVLEAGGGSDPEDGLEAR